MIKTMQTIVISLCLMASATQALELFSEDFESPDVSGGYNQGITPSDWVRHSVGYRASYSGIVDKDTGIFSAAGGNDQAYMFNYTANPGITTKAGVIGTIFGGITYFVTFDVQAEEPNGERYYRYYLMALADGAARNDTPPATGQTILASQTAGSVPRDGAFHEISVSYTVPVDSPHIGKDLALCFMDYYNGAGGELDSGVIDNILVTNDMETTPPAIDTLNPADDATDVALDGNLAITFDENVVTNAGSLTLTNITDGTSLVIPMGDSQLSLSTNTLTLNPLVDLLPAKTYAVLIDSTAVRDVYITDFPGISDTNTWRFSTVATDTVDPSLLSVSPETDTEVVDPGVNLVATFSENVVLVNGGTITFTNITDGTASVITLPDLSQVTVSDRDVTIDPSSNLDSNDTYAVLFDANAIDDTSGNSFSGIADTNTWRLVTAGPPAVTVNGGASSIAIGTATLNGIITLGDSADVYICWGTDDGGTSGTGSWQNVVSLGSRAEAAAFSTSLTGLYYGIEYDYRVYATNSYGSGWSASADSFLTASALDGLMSIATFREITGTESLTTANFDHTWDTTVRTDSGYTLNANGYDIECWAGHHLVLYSTRFDDSAESGSNRSEFQSQLRVAGSDSSIGWSQAYIRRADNDYEGVCAGGGIIEVPSDGDAVSLRSFRTDDNSSAPVAREPNASGVQLVKLDDAWDYCRLSQSSNVSGAPGTAYTDVTYDTQDELDTGSFGHTSGSADIELKSTGHYLVLANTYFQDAADGTKRSGFVQRLTLGGSEIPGSLTEVYLRGANTAVQSCGDGAAATAMIITNGVAGQMLNVECYREESSLTPRIVGGRTAITIVKLPDSGDYLLATDGGSDNLNPSSTAALGWSETLEGASAFSHTDSQLGVNVDDDYLLLCALLGDDTRTDNVRSQFLQQWRKNGSSTYPYGSTSRYSRNPTDTNGENQKGGNRSGIVVDLANGDYMETITTALSQTGTTPAESKSVQALRLGSVKADGNVITNTAAVDIAESSAGLVGILNGVGAVYDVYVYWSTNDNADANAWLIDGTATNFMIGSYTNADGLSVTGSVSSLTGATTYFYSMMATNTATNYWALPNATFDTQSGETDPPVIVTLTPGNGATDVSMAANLVATFDESVYQITGGIVTITNLTDNTATAITLPDSQVAISSVDSNLTINLDADLEEGDVYAVLIDNATAEDVFGNDFLGINDTNTWQFTVEAVPPTLASSDIVDDQGGGPIYMNSLVTYTVSFNEDMDASTVSSSDFVNAGTAPIVFGSITEASPGVFSVEVTPTNWGTLQIELAAGASLTDADGVAMNTTSAVQDDTTITVNFIQAVFSEDFEIPSTPVAYSAGTTPSGWVRSTEGFKAGYHGITDKAGGDFSAPDPNHQAYAFRYSSNAGITSGQGQIGKLFDGVTYFVSFDIIEDGGRPDADDIDYDFKLIAFADAAARNDVTATPGGSMVISSQTGSGPTNGSFQTVTLSVTGDSITHAGYIGLDLGVRFRGSFTTALIDNLVVKSDMEIEPPNIISLSPANGATDVALDADLVATFDEEIVADTGNIIISNITAGTSSPIDIGDPQISISTSVLTVNASADLEANRTYAILIESTALKDVYVTNFEGISDSNAWRFETIKADAGSLFRFR